MNTLHRITKGLVFIFGVITLVGCSSASKLLEKGEYDPAIRKALSKAKNKDGTIKAKYVDVLEAALYEANSNDLEDIKRWRQSNRKDKWEHINAISHKINHRQKKVSAYLPLIDEYGRSVQAKFVDVNQTLKQSAEKAAVVLYDDGLSYMNNARRGDILAARDAYTAFNKVNGYNTDYKNSRTLAREAKELGVVDILVGVENNSYDLLPRAFEDELFNARLTSDTWKRYDVYPSHNNYDVEMVVRIDRVDIGREKIRKDEEKVEKKISLGLKPVLDSAGLLQKGSDGKVLKKEEFETAVAWVTTIKKEKDACIRGEIIFLEAGTNRVINSYRINESKTFKDQACRVRGDKRALNGSHSERRASGFPSDRDMLMDLSRALKCEMERTSRRFKYI